MAKSMQSRGIPTELSLEQFRQFVLPHLTVGRSGAEASLHALFNYILKLPYLGCQWKEMPIAKDAEGRPEIHYTRNYGAFRRWQAGGCFDIIFTVVVLRLHGVVHFWPFWGNKRARGNGRPDLGQRGCCAGEAVSPPASGALVLKRSEAQQGEPVRMAFAGHAGSARGISPRAAHRSGVTLSRHPARATETKAAAFRRKLTCRRSSPGAGSIPANTRSRCWAGGAARRLRARGTGISRGSARCRPVSGRARRRRRADHRADCAARNAPGGCAAHPPARDAPVVSGGQNARLSGREMPSGSLSPVLATSGQRGFNRAAHAELKVAFPLSTSAFR
jgi:hypothetical protein